MKLIEMNKAERQIYLNTLYEDYNNLSKEDQSKYWKLKKEADLINQAELFLEKANLPEGEVLTEKFINRRDWILKQVAVYYGYYNSSDIKKYLIENYVNKYVGTYKK